MNYSSVVPADIQKKIVEIYETMTPCPGKDSNNLAKEWLKTHNNVFAGFVNNEWLAKSDSADNFPIINPFTNEQYANICIANPEILESAAKAAVTSLKTWNEVPETKKSDILLKISSTMESNAKVLAEVECILSGKHLSRIQTNDVPNLIQSFQYYASFADICTENKQCKKTGVVCVIAEEYNEPTLHNSWRISTLLAAGNTVLLLVDKKTCLSAFLVAEICKTSGLPPGVLNVLPIDQDNITCIPQVSKLIFNGSFSKSKKIIELASKEKIAFEVCVSRRPVAIVYESADIASAVDGVLETLCYSDTRSDRSGCKVLIQSSIEKKFHQLLEEKFAQVSVGSNLSQTDITGIVTEDTKKQLSQVIEEAKKQNFKVIEGSAVGNQSLQCKPTAIFNVSTTTKFLNALNLGGGPIIVTIPFKTVKESIAMFNCDKLGYDVSIWTEKLTLALEVTHKLKAGTIWVNTQNRFDASVAYGGAGLGSAAVASGKEAYLKELTQPESPLSSTEDACETSKSKHSYDLHIGGSCKKSSSLSSSFSSNSKKDCAPDVEIAISSALKVQTKWEELSNLKRSKVLLKASSVLNEKMEEFTSVLRDATGEETNICSEEIENSVRKLRFWANRLVTCSNHLIETELHGKVYQDHYPVGVIGIQCPKQKPLQSFLSLLVPAVACGNTVVAVARGVTAAPVLKMCEVLQSSGLPGGVVNALTGDISDLTRALSSHMSLDAFWTTDADAGPVFTSCCIHPKRVFHASGVDRHSTDRMVAEATQQRAVYIPMGTIFAT